MWGAGIVQTAEVREGGSTIAICRHSPLHPFLPLLHALPPTPPYPPLPPPPPAGGCHDTTAMCVRDSELVRMSKNAFKVMSHDSPLALSSLFSNIARRLTAAWDSRLRGGKLEKVGGGDMGIQAVGRGGRAPRVWDGTETMWIVALRGGVVPLYGEGQ